MKAISIVPGTTKLSLIDIPEPAINAADEIKIRIREVGICGTDREEVWGGRADPPSGKHELIIGHEMFGQVTEIGTAVSGAQPGDFGLFIVRRGCGQCEACLNGRSDMCSTGKYTERGIKGADGYQAEYVVDKEQYFVKVPQQMNDVGVLTEPMSVAVKAIDEALTIQTARMQDFEHNGDWFKNRRSLIAGMGPIGLMAAFALKLRGADLVGMDIVDEDSLRPQILKAIGGKYVDGRKIGVADIDRECGESDFVFEATGIADLQIELIDALAINGIYVATGIPSGNRPSNIPAAELMKQLVLNNQVVVGSVNASLHHYQMAVEALAGCLEKWPDTIRSVITERVPVGQFDYALHVHPDNEIKTVIEW